MLKTQLVLKGIMTLEEFHNIKELIQYDFLQDGHFTELKEAELMENKLETLQQLNHILEHSLVRSGYNKMYCVLQIQRLKICKNKLIKKQQNGYR